MIKTARNGPHKVNIEKKYRMWFKINNDDFLVSSLVNDAKNI